MSRPAMLGIRHVALTVSDLEAAERFWVEVMGYEVEWRPDADNVYLHGGRDNLALHRGERSGRRSARPHRDRRPDARRRRRLGRPSRGARRRR